MGEGERALVFFAGTYSHAIRKVPLTEAGEAVLMELELIEPHLFPGPHPRGPDRLALAVAAAAREATP
ncbi:hypothetical protein [Streptomyces virginiae]|uniref:hypothetical protein n=1 Tax=Streptomyces virginiae TaxID=1961 RepID=UPI0036FB6F71